MRSSRRTLLAWLGTVLPASAPRLAAAQSADYPARPIRVVVTFPPGGSSDALIRMLAPRLAERLGQQIVIENRPGAGGNIGLDLVAKAPADGYTLGVGAAGGLAANASLYPQMPFDAGRDFTPVTMLAAIPFVIVANPAFPADNLGQLIAAARAQPDRISIGHGGNGTAMHLSSALLMQMADIRLNEVAYKGSGPAALDAMSGQVPLAVTDVPAALPQVRAGKLKALAVTSPQRLPSLPEVPTAAEAGVAGYDSTGWFGLVAPAGTAPAVVRRLNMEFTRVLGEEDIQAQMRRIGMEPSPSSPEAFGDYLRSETQKWARVIRTARIRLN